MLSETYKKCMHIGNWFNKHSNEEMDEEWYASEHCATFAKAVCDVVEIINSGIETTAQYIYDRLVKGGFRRVDDHMWDDYCKGFLAGQIIGIPTEENIRKAEIAEQMWEEDKEGKYGYYQEVLNELVNK